MLDHGTRARNAYEPARNDSVFWDGFSAQEYWAKNYQTMEPVDREIATRVSKFFAKHFKGAPRVAAAVDVGSGSNLYPALLMLPWADEIRLTDYSMQNVTWLREAIRTEPGIWPWNPFWRQMKDNDGYRAIKDPARLLRVRCDAAGEGVEQVSIFDLPEARWQLGTMFFVAESITSDFDEYRDAVRCFLAALTPGAPFAAAFMAGSTGYPVGGKEYPALDIDTGMARDALIDAGADEPDVIYFDRKDMPLVRPNYKGMILATGIRR